MISITAKELRESLSAVLQRVMSGEEIQVIYRSRPAIRLVPSQPVKKDFSGAENARKLALLVPKLIRPSVLADSSLDYRQLRDKVMLSDPKYLGSTNK